MVYPKIILLSHLAIAFLPAQAQVNAAYCGSLANGYGPYDYRGDLNALSPRDFTPLPEKRGLVEGAHFTPRVESLIGAKSGGGIGPPGADIDYTLRAFPNHHRALLSVMRYGAKAKKTRPEGLRYDVECYFERAIRFQPNDNVVRMIYTTFLIEKNRKSEAMQQLDVVTNAAKENAFTNYNVGLLYFDLGEHQKALTQAHKAMELGLNKPELKGRLQAAGKWAEPVAASVEPTLAEPSAADSDPTKP